MCFDHAKEVWKLAIKLLNNDIKIWTLNIWFSCVRYNIITMFSFQMCMNEAVPCFWVHYDVAGLIHALPHQHSPHAAIQVGDFYHIQFTICPVQLSAHPIHSYACWDNQPTVHQHLYRSSGQSVKNIYSQAIKEFAKWLLSDHFFRLFLRYSLRILYINWITELNKKWLILFKVISFFPKFIFFLVIPFWLTNNICFAIGFLMAKVWNKIEDLSLHLIKHNLFLKVLYIPIKCEDLIFAWNHKIEANPTFIFQTDVNYLKLWQKFGICNFKFSTLVI